VVSPRSSASRQSAAVSLEEIHWAGSGQPPPPRPPPSRKFLSSLLAPAPPPPSGAAGSPAPTRRHSSIVYGSDKDSVEDFSQNPFYRDQRLRSSSSAALPAAPVASSYPPQGGSSPLAESPESPLHQEEEQQGYYPGQQVEYEYQAPGDYGVDTQQQYYQPPPPQPSVQEPYSAGTGGSANSLYTTSGAAAGPHPPTPPKDYASSTGEGSPGASQHQGIDYAVEDGAADETEVSSPFAAAAASIMAGQRSERSMAGAGGTNGGTSPHGSAAGIASIVTQAQRLNHKLKSAVSSDVAFGEQPTAAAPDGEWKDSMVDAGERSSRWTDVLVQRLVLPSIVRDVGIFDARNCSRWAATREFFPRHYNLVNDDGSRASINEAASMIHLIRTGTIAAVCGGFIRFNGIAFNMARSRRVRSRVSNVERLAISGEKRKIDTKNKKDENQEDAALLTMMMTNKSTLTRDDVKKVQQFMKKKMKKSQLRTSPSGGDSHWTWDGGIYITSTSRAIIIATWACDSSLVDPSAVAKDKSEKEAECRRAIDLLAQNMAKSGC